VRVIVADDAPTFRAFLNRELTELGADVVAEAATPDELIAAVHAHRPQAAIIDICFGGYRDQARDEAGLIAAARLRADCPELGLIMFSVYMTSAYLDRILKISSSHIGYLGKDRINDFSVLVDALDRVVAGGTVIDQSLSAKLLRRRRARSLLDGLSPRKRQVLDLLVQGLTNKAIATRMHLKEQTVEGYLSEIFAHLDIAESPEVHKRVCAVLAWLDELRAHGIASPDG
jgi:DNA-binding NarL/FixJ family response regulator